MSQTALGADYSCRRWDRLRRRRCRREELRLRVLVQDSVIADEGCRYGIHSAVTLHAELLPSFG